jgi:hypothetical protein
MPHQQEYSEEKDREYNPGHCRGSRGSQMGVRHAWPVEGIAHNRHLVVMLGLIGIADRKFCDRVIKRIAPAAIATSGTGSLHLDRDPNH